MALLTIKDVVKDFSLQGEFLGRDHNIKRAVDAVSFDVRQGEHFCLIGESGCGKTTLARIIVRLYQATAGTILFQDRPIESYSKRLYTSKVQMVFQDPYSSLDPRFSIEGILKEALYFQPMPMHAKKNMMVNILKEVGLSDDVLYRFPHEFSGGERQRIAIARALLFNPVLLVLDEAVSSLDVLIQQQMMELLQSLQQKYDLTYLSISHNLRVVKKYCDRVAVMRQGKIVEQGHKEKIFMHPQEKYTQELLSAALQYRLTQNNEGDGHV